VRACVKYRGILSPWPKAVHVGPRTGAPLRDIPKETHESETP
jgi:hypothetical protein